jgi:hypothetical protein
MIVGISEAIRLLLTLFTFLISIVKLNVIIYLKKSLFLFNYFFNAFLLALAIDKYSSVINSVSFINGEKEQNIK